MPYLGPSPEKLTNKDVNGGKLVLDADADTSITADTDDQIDIEIAGSDEIKITSAMIAPATADGSALGGASNEWSDLYLADSGVIYFGNDQDITITHDPDDGLFFKSVATSDDSPFVLTLQSGETDLHTDDIIGQIDFQAPDEGVGGDAVLVSGSIRAVSEGNFSSSSNATSLKFFTGNSAAAGSDGGSMILNSTGNLTLKDLRTADGSSPTITLQTGDTDIAANDVLGTINFQAPDEGTGTDAILVAAGIEAVSEGDFSSSSNATKLSFKTGASAAASEKVSISSAGILTIQGEGSNTTNATHGVLKAWANLSGSGTPAIDDSLNCASVTDHGTGDREIVIANDMANANYAATAGLLKDDNSGSTRGAAGHQIATQLATGLRYTIVYGSTSSSNGAVSDSGDIDNMMFAGDLS